MRVHLQGQIDAFNVLTAAMVKDRDEWREKWILEIERIRQKESDSADMLQSRCGDLELGIRTHIAKMEMLVDSAMKDHARYERDIQNLEQLVERRFRPRD